MALHKENDKKNLRLDLELLKRSMLERNQRTYLAISIVIPTSLLVILSCLQNQKTLRNEIELFSMFSIPLGAPILLVILLMLGALLYLHVTAFKVQKMEYRTIDKIIDNLGKSSFPSLQMYKKELKPKLWFKLRKYVWAFAIMLLILCDCWALWIFWGSWTLLLLGIIGIFLLYNLWIMKL